MANELKFPYPSGAGTTYCRVLNPAGQVFRSDTNVFETINAANAANYAAAAMEDSGLNTYIGSFPMAITTAGVIQYGVEFCLQAGASPAAADVVVGAGVLYWNGTSEVFPATDIPGQPGAGSGPIAINQNTGGTDNLRYVDQNGNGIGAAEVLIYLASDWPGNPGRVQAVATTGADGRWLSPAFVASGTYVAVFMKLGADGPDVSGPFTV